MDKKVTNGQKSYKWTKTWRLRLSFDSTDVCVSRLWLEVSLKPPSETGAKKENQTATFACISPLLYAYHQPYLLASRTNSTTRCPSDHIKIFLVRQPCLPISNKFINHLIISKPFWYATLSSDLE